MSTLEEELSNYLKLRQGLGYKLADAHRLLPRFVAWMNDQGHQSITIEAALAWCQLPAYIPDSVVWPKRMTAVRGFARYMAGIDPDTQVPPIGLLPSRQRWRPPYIYTAHDIAALMHQARSSLDPRLPAATYETLIGLLSAAGLRIGEAIRLDRDDVDWDQATLLIRESKFGKTRLVPLHAEVLEALQTYAKRRDQVHSDLQTSAFFVTVTGKRLLYTVVGETFRALCTRAKVGIGASRHPRLHDLRHTFAVNTLVGWYRQGADVHARMPFLAAYLGHRDPGFTYWYLSAAPELLALAAQRIENTDATTEGQS